MGTLSLPYGGAVYVDSSVVIYSVEAHARYWPLLEPLWLAGRAGRLRFVASELAIAETFVAPIRHGDARLQQAYEDVFVAPEMELVPVTGAILREAAALRAGIKSLRLPDAIHAATSQARRCDLFVTNDRRLSQIRGLNVQVLDDVLQVP